MFEEINDSAGVSNDSIPKCFIIAAVMNASVSRFTYALQWLKLSMAFVVLALELFMTLRFEHIVPTSFSEFGLKNISYKI